VSNSALTVILFIALPILIIPGVYRLAARITYRRTRYQGTPDREETPPAERIFSEHEPREPEIRKNRNRRPGA